MSGKITLRITLFADLRRHFAKHEAGRRELSLPAGTTVATLLDAIGIAGEERDQVTVGVNGERATLDSVLADGDDITMFSPMEGG